jgi:hypothetical protein
MKKAEGWSVHDLSIMGDSGGAVVHNEANANLAAKSLEKLFRFLEVNPPFLQLPYIRGRISGMNICASESAK